MSSEARRAGGLTIVPSVVLQVFRKVQRAALNLLHDPYVALLLADNAAALLAELGAKSCALALPDPVVAAATGGDDDDDDYAAGW